MKIKGVILDVDGTLTNGKKYYFSSPAGTVIAKGFSVRDGKGVNLIQKTGVKVAIITADPWKLIVDRAHDMGIEDIYYHSHDKIADVRKFCEKYGLALSQLCFIGDDVNDIPLLEVVAFPVAVGDAEPRVKNTVRNRGGLITKNLGGAGAVREALEYIMENNKI